MTRQKSKESLFSELTRQELEQLYSMDDYCFDRRYFPVMGKEVEVHDWQIAEAFQKLSEKKREILLMLYFLDMTETESLLLSTDVVNASEKGPYVLTNTSRINGANALVQEELLAQVGDVLGGDYYVLPSSTHELILIQDDGSISKEAMEQMVTEINSTQVPKKDLLSNKVQFYDSRQKQLRLDKNEVAKEKIAEQGKGMAERKVRRNIKEPKKFPHKL